MMNEQQFPKGWDEQRVKRLIAELDARTDAEWIAADEAAAADSADQAGSDAMSNTKAQEFFKQAILDNILGDIEHLKRNHGGKAGPLLACVVNGIDVMGAILLGFNVGSAKRSKEFMVKYMRLSDKQADATYRVIRCGVAHEGAPKMSLEFFVHEKPDQAKNLLYQRDNGRVCLDVLALAALFEDAVETIKKADPSPVAHRPDIHNRDTQALEAIEVSSLPRYEDFCETLRPSGRSSVPSDYQPPGFTIEAQEG